jgi:hypothetical protein
MNLSEFTGSANSDTPTPFSVAGIVQTVRKPFALASHWPVMAITEPDSWPGLPRARDSFGGDHHWEAQLSSSRAWLTESH